MHVSTLKNQVQTLSPQTLLEKGTPVTVGGKRGFVVSSVLVDAHNGGKIALTSIKFKQQFKRGFGKNGVWENLKKPVTQTVNYSAIKI